MKSDYFYKLILPRHALTSMKMLTPRNEYDDLNIIPNTLSYVMTILLRPIICEETMETSGLVGGHLSSKLN